MSKKAVEGPRIAALPAHVCCDTTDRVVRKGSIQRDSEFDATMRGRILIMEFDLRLRSERHSHCNQEHRISKDQAPLPPIPEHRCRLPRAIRPLLPVTPICREFRCSHLQQVRPIRSRNHNRGGGTNVPLAQDWGLARIPSGTLRTQRLVLCQTTRHNSSKILARPCNHRKFSGTLPISRGAWQN